MEVFEGFPDIHGYVMQNHIDCRFPTSIMLWFHNHTPDLTALIHVQVFLLGASMKGANVELKPFFPDLTSYSIKPEVVHGRPKNLLSIAFDKGEMSFLFEKVFHVRWSHPMHVPDELKKGLAQK